MVCVCFSAEYVHIYGSFAATSFVCFADGSLIIFVCAVNCSCRRKIERKRKLNRFCEGHFSAREFCMRMAGYSGDEKFSRINYILFLDGTRYLRTERRGAIEFFAEYSRFR